MELTFTQLCENGDLDCLDQFENLSNELIYEGLEIAIQHKQYDLVQKLMLHLPKKYISTELLDQVIGDQDLKLVKILSSNVDLLCPNDFCNSLVTAAEENAYDIFDYLISLLSVEQKHIILSVLVQLGYLDYVALLLRDKSIDITYLYQGKDIVSHAIRKGKLEVLELLLRDKRIVVTEEYLYQGASRGNGPVMKLLLSYFPRDIPDKEKLIEKASSRDHEDVLLIIFSDVRINPWNIKSSSNMITRIINLAKSSYNTQSAYLDKYKLFSEYIRICGVLDELQFHINELHDKEVEKNNLGYLYLNEQLEKNRFTECSLKNKLGLLC